MLLLAKCSFINLNLMAQNPLSEMYFVRSIMINNLKRLVRKEVSKDEMIEFILGQEEHAWILANSYVHAHILDLLEGVPRKTLEEIFIHKATLMVRSSGRYACSVGKSQQNIIIIFPEVYEKLTRTHSGWAKAVLAHEMGHIHLNHSETTNTDELELQVDADQFACDLGYMEELESFLHDQRDSVEVRVRLSFITSYYFSQNQ